MRRPRLRRPAAPAAASKATGRLSPGLVVALAVLCLVLLWAIAPQLFTAQSPAEGVPADKLQPPSGLHPFGTDHLGRDIASRIVHGAALTLSASLLAVGIGLAAGTALGLCAGFAGARLDAALMRLVDVMLAVPSLLLSLTVVVALGFGTMSVAIAVGVGSIAAFARLTRSEVVRVRHLDFVEASLALGRSRLGVAVEHVLPNALTSVLALATLELGSAILSVSALSFLGFGAQPPAPEWGQMVADGRNYLTTAWWMTTFPGLVVVAVVISADTVGRALEHDPRGAV